MATVDASIPLGVRPVQIESPVNQLAKVLQIKEMQQGQQIGQMKMDEYQRGIEDQNALRSALSAPGADPYNVLIRYGRTKDALEWQKGQGDIKKTGAETDYKRIETAGKKVAFFKEQMFNVNDPQTAAQLITAMHSDPDLQPLGMDKVPLEKMLAQIPQDPAQFGAFKEKYALGAEKFMADLRMKAQQAETGRHNRASEGLTASGQRITMRGQDMVNQRAQEANSAGRVPAGYRQKGDGSLEFIPGGPADPNAAKKAAPTEFQGKAGMFGNRAQEADRIITSLEGKYSPAGINTKQALGGTPLLGGALEAGANVVLSNESQKAEQAQRDFVNAVLRLESGAAIAESEFNNAKKQYFPQPGDAPAVIAQKAANRKTAIQGLMSNARPGADAAASATKAPNIDSLLDKYK